MLISSLKAQQSCWSSALEEMSDLGTKMAHYYPRKMGKWGLLNSEMGCGERGEEGNVWLWNLQLCGNLFILATRALCAFRPSISQTAHLAPCLIAYLSLQPLSITQLLHLLLVANLLLGKPQNTLRWITWEWHLSQLFELREAGSWVGGKLERRALLEQHVMPSKTESQR